MIGILGISHKSAPVSIRELYAFDEQEKVNFVCQVQHALQLEGMVILSTCNRTEIYFNSLLEDSSGIYKTLTVELLRFRNTAEETLQHFYFYTQEEAVRQLFRVASGLDSLVLGEEQILVQVKETFRNAQAAKLTDCILSRLFIKAIEAGKRVRTETHLNKGAASVSYAAVELSHELFPDLSDRTVMVIGAGQTGDLILQSLLKKSRPTLIIANRTLSKAEELASRYTGKAVELSEIENCLPQCDLVFTATSSKEHLITRDMVSRGMNHRSLSQVYIDLSVPTNIEENVKEVEQVQHFGVDDLKAVVSKNVERRKSATEQSLEIISEVLEEFMEWLDFQNLTPTIISIKENLRIMQQTEMEGFKKHNKIKEAELIEQYSEHISEKVAQMFIRKLKQVTENGRKTEYIKVINDLFEPIEND